MKFIKLKILFKKVNNQRKNLKKKKMKWNEIFYFFLSYLFLFLKALKVRRPGRKMSSFQTAWILTICLTSRPGMMSGRALSYLLTAIWVEKYILSNWIVCLVKVKQASWADWSGVRYSPWVIIVIGQANVRSKMLLACQWLEGGAVLNLAHFEFRFLANRILLYFLFKMDFILIIL